MQQLLLYEVEGRSASLLIFLRLCFLNPVFYSFYVAVTYEIHIFTGNVEGNETDSNIFINIFGEQSDTGKRQLLRQAQDDDEKQFQQGRVRLSFKDMKRVKPTVNKFISKC